MNKCTLKGEPETLWKQKATKFTQRKDAMYVEFIFRCDLTEYGRGVTYQRRAVGVNANGAAITGVALEDGKYKDYYRWQIGNQKTAEWVLENPESVYRLRAIDF